MEYEKEIPFGTFDSELMHQEIFIPEGFEATIDGNKIILTRIESEDEKIRKAIIEHFAGSHSSMYPYKGFTKKQILAWLEKQGQSYTKRDVDEAFVEGMACAKNELEKQSEQKSVDKVEPTFKVGDWVIFNEHHNSVYQVEKIQGLRYYLRHYLGGTLSVHFDNELIRLWTLKDAKDGDVLATSAGAFIYNGNNGGGSCPGCYCGINTLGRFQSGVEHHWTGKKVYPATKEQRDTLMKAMADAGWEFDLEKNELKKIDEEVNGEDYGIDSLYHAQRILEKTLGNVEGYQSDDGILDHKAAITAVQKTV